VIILLSAYKVEPTDLVLIDIVLYLLHRTNAFFEFDFRHVDKYCEKKTFVRARCVKYDALNSERIQLHRTQSISVQVKSSVKKKTSTCFFIVLFNRHRSHYYSYFSPPVLTDEPIMKYRVARDKTKRNNNNNNDNNNTNLQYLPYHNHYKTYFPRMLRIRTDTRQPSTSQKNINEDHKPQNQSIWSKNVIH